MNESKAARHQRRRRRARAFRAGTGMAVLAVLAWTSAGEALAAWCTRLAGARAAPAVFTLVLLSAWHAVAIAATAAALGRSGRGEDNRTTPAAKIAEAALGLGVTVVAVYALLAARWAAGESWWLLTAAVAVAAEAAILLATPAVLARLSGARPLTRPALIERLGQLARRIRVPIADIEEVPAGAALTSTALVAGSGDSRRIFISSALLRDWEDEEIAVVVAHEMAHHAHYDLWRTLALDTAVLFAACATAAAVHHDFGALDATAALASLPGIALAAGIVWLFATPVRLLLSRSQERRADTFALQLTGSVGEFEAAIRRLAAEHLAEERPDRLTRWWYHRHPTVAERLALAEEFRAR